MTMEVLGVSSPITFLESAVTAELEAMSNSELLRFRAKRLAGNIVLKCSVCLVGRGRNRCVYSVGSVLTDFNL